MAASIFPPATATSVLVNTRTQPKIVFLPAASTITAGKLLFVKDICGNAANSSIYLSTTGRDTFDGRNYRSISYGLMSTNFQSVLLAPDGIINWMILQNYNANAITRATTFSPRNISGLQIWYDASDPLGTGAAVVNGTSLTTWYDKSGNARNAVNQTTSAILNTNVQNGLPVLRFVGVSNYLITYASFPNSAYTIFTVQYLSNNNGYRRVIHAPPGSDAGIFIGVNGANIATFTGNAAGSWNDVNANSPNISNLTAWRIVDTWVSSTVLTPYVDGTAQTNKTGTTGAFSNLTIGMKPGGVQPWYGDVAEILIYSGALTTTPRQQVEGYLAWKWGLQGNLPANHPYKNAAP